MSITQHFLQECLSFQKTHQVKRWVIALSGGLDSSVVLNLAKEQLSALPIVAIHVNHQVQIAANDWQAFCAEQCDKLNISFHSFVISPDGSSEQKLRKARYQCFESFLKEGDCMLFGHHANDQAETVLFRLIRGAGLKGLTGMPANRKISNGWLLRPLLLVNKAILEDYAQENKLLWVDDPSNKSLDYDRNYLRHEVVNPLVSHWSYAVEKIAHTANLLTTDYQLLEQYLARDLADVETSNAFEISLNLKKWREFELEKGKAVLRYWISKTILRPVTQKELERSLSNVIDSKMDSDGAYCPFGEYNLRRYKQKVFLLKNVQISSAWPEVKAMVLEKELMHGYLSIRSSVKGIDLIDGMFLTNDTDGLKLKEENRPRKKLKQIFKENEIAPWLRASWPILMYQDQVVAVLGICISEEWLQEDKNKSLFYPDWQPL